MAQPIHCPNCNYEGPSKDATPGCLQLCVVLFLFIVSCFFWPLVFIAIGTLVYYLTHGKKRVCPKCEWKHVVDIQQWKNTHPVP